MLDLAYQSLAVLVALGGLTLLYWSMFRDRARGRRRCPKCWYDLRGTESLTCPECGYTAGRERYFFKTKRRWRWVVPIVVLLGGSYVLWITPRALRDGWLASLPTPVVIAAMRYEPAASISELKKRWRDKLYRDDDSTQRGWKYRFAISQAKHLLGAEYPIRQRSDALELIFRIDQHEPIGDILLTWLDDPNFAIYTEAIWLASTANLEPTGERVIAEKLYALAQVTDRQTAALATRSLGRFVNDDPRYVDLLVDRLDDQNLGMQGDSAIALAGLKSPEPRVLKALCELMSSGGYGAMSAVDTLGIIGNGTVALPLAEAMRNPDFSMSTKCAKSLLAIGTAAQSADVTSALVASLSDRNPVVRGSAVAALISQGPLAEPFLPDVIKALDLKSTETAARIMIEAKVMGSDSPILAPMISAMVEVSTANIEESTEPYQTCEYLIALMNWNPAHSEVFVPILIRFMNGPSEGLQERAATCLRFYGSRARSALPALQNALEQATTDDAKESIEGAIGAINGKLPRF